MAFYERKFASNGNMHVVLPVIPGSTYYISLCGIERQSGSLSADYSGNTKRCPGCVAIAGALAASPRGMEIAK